jgi:hypothetical protein
MPRFGTKTLLFVCMLVALWCSTFSGYAAAGDVRASVLLLIFLAAGFAAIYHRGRPRAFWAGFFAVMLLCGGNSWQAPVSKYVPNFSWRTQQVGPMIMQYSAPPTTYAAPVPTPPAYRDPLSPYSGSVQITPVPAPVPLLSQGRSEYEFEMAVNATIESFWTLVLGCVAGLVGMWLSSTIGGKSEQN